MTKDQITQLIIGHKPYMNYCRRLCSDHDISNDLYQEFFLFMFTKPEEELVRIYESGYLENYCLAVIFNNFAHRHRFLGGTDGNPLLSISDHSASTFAEVACRAKEYRQQDPVDQKGWHADISGNFDRVMKYLNTDRKIKPEDVALLFESTDQTLKKISERSGVAYITLKVKSAKIKKKIREHVTVS